MTLLSGKSGTKIDAVYLNNILALPTGEVIGVILGHCVFDRRGVVKAKYFTQTLYDLDGRILAKESDSDSNIHIDLLKMQEQGWKIISHIGDHDCPRITPKNEWSTIPLEEHFADA